MGRNTTRERGPGTVDAGWIELDPRTVDSTGLKFVDVRDLKPAKPTRSGLYLVQGLPAQLASLTREKHRCSIRLTAVGCGTEPARSMGQTDDLALRYGPAAFGRAGTTVLVGIYAAEPAMDFNEIVGVERNVIGSVAASPGDMEAAVRLIASGGLRVSDLISAKVPLNRAIEDGFQRMLAPAKDVFRILISP